MRFRAPNECFVVAVVNGKEAEMGSNVEMYGYIPRLTGTCSVSVTLVGRFNGSVPLHRPQRFSSLELCFHNSLLMTFITDKEVNIDTKYHIPRGWRSVKPNDVQGLTVQNNLAKNWLFDHRVAKIPHGLYQSIVPLYMIQQNRAHVQPFSGRARSPGPKCAQMSQG